MFNIADYAFTRPRYEPSRVSISMVSPSVMKRGTLTVAPDSTVAGFSVLVAVSPFNPGSVKGMKVEEVLQKLEGVRCGNRSTSCPDQLCKAVREMKQ